MLPFSFQHAEQTEKKPQFINDVRLNPFLCCFQDSYAKNPISTHPAIDTIITILDVYQYITNNTVVYRILLHNQVIDKYMNYSTDNNNIDNKNIGSNIIDKWDAIYPDPIIANNGTNTRLCWNEVVGGDISNCDPIYGGCLLKNRNRIFIYEKCLRTEGVIATYDSLERDYRVTNRFQQRRTYCVIRDIITKKNISIAVTFDTVKAFVLNDDDDSDTILVCTVSKYGKISILDMTPDTNGKFDNDILLTPPTLKDVPQNQSSFGSNDPSRQKWKQIYTDQNLECKRVIKIIREDLFSQNKKFDEIYSKLNERIWEHKKLKNSIISKYYKDKDNKEILSEIEAWKQSNNQLTDDGGNTVKFLIDYTHDHPLVTNVIYRKPFVVICFTSKILTIGYFPDLHPENFFSVDISIPNDFSIDDTLSVPSIKSDSTLSDEEKQNLERKYLSLSFSLSNNNRLRWGGGGFSTVGFGKSSDPLHDEKILDLNCIWRSGLIHDSRSFLTNLDFYPYSGSNAAVAVSNDHGEIFLFFLTVSVNNCTISYSPPVKYFLYSKQSQNNVLSYLYENTRHSNRAIDYFVKDWGFFSGPNISLIRFDMHGRSIFVSDGAFYLPWLKIPDFETIQNENLPEITLITNLGPNLDLSSDSDNTQHFKLVPKFKDSFPSNHLNIIVTSSNMVVFVSCNNLIGANIVLSENNKFSAQVTWSYEANYHIASLFPIWATSPTSNEKPLIICKENNLTLHIFDFNFTKPPINTIMWTKNDESSSMWFPGMIQKYIDSDKIQVELITGLDMSPRSFVLPLSKDNFQYVWERPITATSENPTFLESTKKANYLWNIFHGLKIYPNEHKDIQQKSTNLDDELYKSVLLLVNSIGGIQKIRNFAIIFACTCCTDACVHSFTQEISSWTSRNIFKALKSSFDDIQSFKSTCITLVANNQFITIKMPYNCYDETPTKQVIIRFVKKTLFLLSGNEHLDNATTEDEWNKNSRLWPGTKANTVKTAESIEKRYSYTLKSFCFVSVSLDFSTLALLDSTFFPNLSSICLDGCEKYEPRALPYFSKSAQLLSQINSNSDKLVTVGFNSLETLISIHDYFELSSFLVENSTSKLKVQCFLESNDSYYTISSSHYLKILQIGSFIEGSNRGCLQLSEYELFRSAFYNSFEIIQIGPAPDIGGFFMFPLLFKSSNTLKCINIMTSDVYHEGFPSFGPNRFSYPDNITSSLLKNKETSNKEFQDMFNVLLDLQKKESPEIISAPPLEIQGAPEKNPDLSVSGTLITGKLFSSRFLDPTAKLQYRILCGPKLPQLRELRLDLSFIDDIFLASLARAACLLEKLYMYVNHVTSSGLVKYLKQEGPRLYLKELCFTPTNQPDDNLDDVQEQWVILSQMKNLEKLLIIPTYKWPFSQSYKEILSSNLNKILNLAISLHSENEKSLFPALKVLQIYDSYMKQSESMDIDTIDGKKLHSFVYGLTPNGGYGRITPSDSDKEKAIAILKQYRERNEADKEKDNVPNSVISRLKFSPLFYLLHFMPSLELACLDFSFYRDEFTSLRAFVELNILNNREIDVHISGLNAQKYYQFLSTAKWINPENKDYDPYSNSMSEKELNVLGENPYQLLEKKIKFCYDNDESIFNLFTDLDWSDWKLRDLFCTILDNKDLEEFM